MTVFVAGSTLTHDDVDLIRELSDYDHPDRSRELDRPSPQVQIALDRLGVDNLTEGINKLHRLQRI